MSENKAIENLILKVSFDEMSSEEFASRKSIVKKDILKNILTEKRQTSKFKRQIWVLGLFASLALIILTGFFYLNYSSTSEKNADIIFLDSAINDLGDSTNGSESNLSINELNSEDLYY